MINGKLGGGAGLRVTPLMKYGGLNEALWWELPETEISISQVCSMQANTGQAVCTQWLSQGPTTPCKYRYKPVSHFPLLIAAVCWWYSLKWATVYSPSVRAAVGQEEAK